MKLREFLAYKNECPICTTTLVTSFHSKRKQKFRYEDDRFIIIFDLNSLKKGQKNYKVGYSIGLDDNSFYAEFYTYDDVRYQNDTQTFLIDRFKELNKNLQLFTLYKSCSKCERYSYKSNDFTINYKSCNIGDIYIDIETSIMVQPTSMGYKVYKMVNYLKTKETWLNYGKIKLEQPLSLTEDKDINKMRIANLDVKGFLQTSLINFTTHDETANRISKLILFS